MKRSHDNALIIFTREPQEGSTKTRMMPYLTPSECCELHRSILGDLAEEMSAVEADVLVCYTSSDGEFSFLRAAFDYASSFFAQEGDDLGERMYNAVEKVLNEGYQRCALIGTDIPAIDSAAIHDAFGALDASDVVLGPTGDGGYCLIAMKEASEAPFKAGAYGCSTVLQNTIRSIEAAGLAVSTRGLFYDVDTKEDLAFYRKLLRSQKISSGPRFARFIWEHLKLSVIVPVYNEEAVIERLLSQLEPVREELEVIIVDGGSTDRTIEIIGDRFKVIHSGKGRAVQQNAGAAEAAGDILFFLHCDSILPEDWVSQLGEVVRRSEYGCFGVHFPSRHIFMLTNTIISNYRAFSLGIPFCDQGIFLEKHLFEEMGGFPELPILEDYQFSLNMRARGYKPDRTRDRITTSVRRYGTSTWSIMKTEYQMWNIRRRYMKGVPAEVLAWEYRDIR